MMRKRGIDCLIIPHNTGEWDNYQSDTRYLTCVGGGGAATALIFPLEGDPIVIVREARRIDWWRDQQDWVIDIRALRNFSWASAFEGALRERNMGGARIGVVGIADVLRDAEGTAAYGEVAALKKAFPQAVFESATDLLGAVRKCKSAEELEMMRQAQACADALSDALHAHARPGVAEHTLYAEMMAAHIRAGGEAPTMVLFSADSRMWQTHLLPRFRLIAQDDIIMIEAEAKYFGYIAQSVETIAFRAFSHTERMLLNTSYACFEEILAAMKPGVPYADLIALWEKSANRDGCKAGRTLGHGLGMGQDGPLTTRGGKAGGMVVEDGDCFVLKPWIDDETGHISGRVGSTIVVENGIAARIGRTDIRCFTPH